MIPCSIKMRWDSLDDSKNKKILELYMQGDEIGLRKYLKDLGFTDEEIDQIIGHLKCKSNTAYDRLIAAYKKSEKISS